MNRILNIVLFDTNSVARSLQHSEVFADIFEQELRLQKRVPSCSTQQSKMRNLSSAKQRFDSSAKPLARVLFNLDATISTCQIIRDSRGSTDKAVKHCNAFLEMLTPLTVILLGMMADNEECLALTRFSKWRACHCRTGLQK